MMVFDIDEGRKLPTVDEVPAPKRKCGSCRACCTVMGVTELDKPAYARCEHETPKKKGKKGCGIYTGRPQSCADYQCYWKHGMAKWSDRPDKVGIVVDSSPQLQRLWGSLAVQVREVYPGAAKSKRAAEMIDLMGRGAVFIIRADGTRGFFSHDEELMAKFRAMVEAHGAEQVFSEEG